MGVHHEKSAIKKRDPKRDEVIEKRWQE